MKRKEQCLTKAKSFTSNDNLPAFSKDHFSFQMALKKRSWFKTKHETLKNVTGQKPMHFALNKIRAFLPEIHFTF